MPVSNAVRRFAKVLPPLGALAPVVVAAVDAEVVVPAPAVLFEPPPPHAAASSMTPTARAPALNHFARCARVTVLPPGMDLLPARQASPARAAGHCYRTL